MNYVVVLVIFSLTLALTGADSSEEMNNSYIQMVPIDNNILGNFVSLCSRGRTHHIPATNTKIGSQKIDSTTDEFIVYCTYKCLKLFNSIQEKEKESASRRQEENTNKVHYVYPSVENIKQWIDRIAPQPKSNQKVRHQGSDNHVIAVPKGNKI